MQLMEYQHTQHGYTGILTTAFFAVVAWFSLPDTLEESLWVGLLIVVFFVFIVGLTFWFSWLNVAVREGAVTAEFGLGRPHRVIELSDITAVVQVRNYWIQGWGVRKISNGWMYNVWGLDAVELELTSGKVFRIGTDEADRLHAAIALQR